MMKTARLTAALVLALGTAGAAWAMDGVEEIRTPAFFDHPAVDGLKARAAQEPGAPGYSARDVALAWHGLASLGTDGAAHRAVELLGALPEAESDPMLKAYLGSAYLMKARDQSFVPARVRSVRKGLNIMNEAAAAAPGDFSVHAIRAGSAMNLPDIFGYRATVRQDLELALTLIDEGKAGVTDGSVEEGRMLAALVKICLLAGDMGCAGERLAELETGFDGDPALRDASARLRAAFDQPTN